LDTEKIGAFIAALRKSRGLTQQEVADALGITDKTVSKWECGKGLPDITAIPAIAELFGVTADEILRGERIAPSAAPAMGRKSASRRSAWLLERKCRRCRWLFYGVYAIALTAFLLLFILLESTYSGPISCGVSLVLCAGGTFMWMFARSQTKDAAVFYAETEAEALSAEPVHAALRLSHTTMFPLAAAAALDICILFTSASYGHDILPYIARGNLMQILGALLGGTAALIASVVGGRSIRSALEGKEE